MSVWFCIPSKRPPEQAGPILQMWRECGYRVAVYLDSRTPGVTPPWPIVHACADRVLDRFEYPGYAAVVNILVKDILEQDPEAQWIVTGGDDVQPDLNHTAEEIAAQCSKHFAELHAGPDAAPGVSLSVQSIRAALNGVALATFGVMQPTGDRWGDHGRNTHAWEPWPEHPHRCIHCGQGEDTPPHMHGAYIDRVCGSPWMGREFCLRINQGKGPLWPAYFHMGEDEELQAVAKKHGILWQRPDLIHLHQHWGRTAPGQPLPSTDRMPAFLKEANSEKRWQEYKELFRLRKLQGFPGSDPL